MAALLIGYAHCSTDHQDLTAQHDGLTALGVSPARIYQMQEAALVWRREVFAPVSLMYRLRFTGAGPPRPLGFGNCSSMPPSVRLAQS